MFVGELKGLHQAQSLVNRATNRQVVNGHLPQDALVIDDEEASEKEDRSHLTISGCTHTAHLNTHTSVAVTQLPTSNLIPALTFHRLFV